MHNMYNAQFLCAAQVKEIESQKTRVYLTQVCCLYHSWGRGCCYWVYKVCLSYFQFVLQQHISKLLEIINLQIISYH